ncbi:hypothetical protein [Methylorubrum extorquens]|uniref:DNA-directed RNA polymerase n=1 Tax=Methylorubrum extorquens TaxID=408 RepID=A0AAX3WB86_METEX|nr:hypothetical protein [Methylorubrum extorquens]WHQ68533.1 hypothetical protein KEC54_19405 [Methylorubrum extorquens]
MTPHTDELRPRDRTWGFDWRASPKAIAALGIAQTGCDRHERTLSSMVAALGLAAETDQPWLSYSRSRDWYAEGHYDRTPITYSTVIASVSRLGEAGLIEEIRAKRGAHLARVPLQSRIRATPLLVERLSGTRFEHMTPAATLIMRDDDGRAMRLPNTEMTRRMQAEVDAINEAAKRLVVTVSPDASPEDWQRTEHHLKARKVRDGRETWACALPSPSNHVVRILGRGRHDCHGRLYGWWQQLSKERRGELLINGELLIEEDFAALHPTLLYAMKGIRLDFDPYDTEAFPRQHCKWALNVAINAGSMKAAVDALMWKPGWSETRCYTELLVGEVAHRNEPIREFLGSDAGVRLMAFDSGMAIDVLKRCRKSGVDGVLPVHDSFLAPRRSGGQVTAIMQDVLDTTRVWLSGTTSIASTRTIRQTVRRGPAAPAAPPPPVPAVSAPSREACLKKSPGKVDFSPAQPVSEPVSVPAPVSSREAPTPDWDLSERTLALTVHFEQRERSHLGYVQHVLGGGAATASETRHAFARAREEAVAMAEQEWREGRRLVDRVPDRLSDRVKAQRARKPAPKPRRPMPRPRKPSTFWAKPEVPPVQGKAQP